MPLVDQETLPRLTSLKAFLAWDRPDLPRPDASIMAGFSLKERFFQQLEAERKADLDTGDAIRDIKEMMARLRPPDRDPCYDPCWDPEQDDGGRGGPRAETLAEIKTGIAGLGLRINADIINAKRAAVRTEDAELEELLVPGSQQQTAAPKRTGWGIPTACKSMHRVL